jgi:hypothetical protein
MLEQIRRICIHGNRARQLLLRPAAGAKADDLDADPQSRLDIVRCVADHDRFRRRTAGALERGGHDIRVWLRPLGIVGRRHGFNQFCRAGDLQEVLQLCLFGGAGDDERFAVVAKRRQQALGAASRPKMR